MNRLFPWKPCCLSVTGTDIIQALPLRVATFLELAESYSGSAPTSTSSYVNVEALIKKFGLLHLNIFGRLVHVRIYIV